MLQEYGITSSVSRRGNCWNNVCSEALFGSLRVERLRGQRFATRCHARGETIAWLVSHNKTWLYLRLAHISPMRFKQTWLTTQLRQANS